MSSCRKGPPAWGPFWRPLATKATACRVRQTVHEAIQASVAELKSGRPGSNRRRPAWEADLTIPVEFASHSVRSCHFSDSDVRMFAGVSAIRASSAEFKTEVSHYSGTANVTSPLHAHCQSPIPLNAVAHSRRASLEALSKRNPPRALIDSK
jgi:hypothetical protein